MSISSSSVRKWLSAFVSLSFFCAVGLGMLAEEGNAEETETTNLLLQKITDSANDLSNLPTRLSEFPRNFDATDIQMPQEGEYVGVVTRETALYDEKHLFSVFYPLLTAVTLSGTEDPFKGIINAPESIFPSRLPDPKPQNTKFLGGAVLSASEKITFSPPALLRYPVGEQQKGNTDLTVYRYNEENEKYETVPYTFSENGEGVLVDIVKNGIYILCDRPAEFAVEERGGEEDEKTLSSEESLSEDEEISESEENASPETESISYRDIATHWGKEYINLFTSAGLSFSNNTHFFFPDALATRSEVVRILVQHLGATQETETCLEEMMPSKNAVVFFTDIRQDQQNADYLCVAARKKLITGRVDGSFGPDDEVSRAEALALLYRVSTISVDTEITSSLPFEDVSSGSWFAPFVAQAVADGVASGFTEYEGGSLRIDAERIGGGESGERVKQLQRILTELEFFSGDIDGIFSEKLKNSVLQYQLSRGILQTPSNPSAGVVGPSTVAMLNGELSAKNVGTQTKLVFRPNDPVTHAEVAKFASAIFGL